MTYAIGTFIFGVNLREDELPIEYQGVVSELNDMELVESRYSGGGEPPMFLGVDVDNIDECGDMGWAEIVELKEKLKAVMEPNSNERQEYTKKLAELKKAIADGIENPDFEPEEYAAFVEWLEEQEPEVFLTWGSS